MKSGKQSELSGLREDLKRLKEALKGVKVLKMILIPHILSTTILRLQIQIGKGNQIKERRT